MTGNPHALIIRDATERDLQAVRSLYAHHVLHGFASFEEVPPPIEELRRRWVSVISSHLPYLIAEIDARLVGYAYASAYRPRPAYRYTIEDSVYVASGLGGQGIGSALLGALIARCEAGCWRQMLAVIGDSGNSASIALHRRFGFEAVGSFTSVGFKLGRWVDTVLMQRPLGAGATLPPQQAAGGPAQARQHAPSTQSVNLKPRRKNLPMMPASE